MIAGDEMSCDNGFPQRSQVAIGSSFMLCLISNL
jgi:hypothetical protein